MIALSHAFILIAQKAHKIRQDIYLPDLPLFVTLAAHQFCAFIAQHCKQFFQLCNVHMPPPRYLWCTDNRCYRRRSGFLHRNWPRELKGRYHKKFFSSIGPVGHDIQRENRWNRLFGHKTTQNSHPWFSLSILAQNVEPFLCDTLPLRDPCPEFQNVHPCNMNDIMQVCGHAHCLVKPAHRIAATSVPSQSNLFDGFFSLCSTLLWIYEE